ncbi:MAG TPA: DUF3097 family protein [Pseudonocardiaceae bacterium]|nr:DUF3097 family protein [Pseudonocardiaceae bacterium]
MRSQDYGDIFDRGRRAVPEVVADAGLVVEDPDTGFCGAVLGVHDGKVMLEDGLGRRRLFPLRTAGFLLEGKLVTLIRPTREPLPERSRSASGSRRVDGLKARVARQSRIWVEGVHDATLIERVWGHDLRVEGIVVEPLHGVDDLARRVADFEPAPDRRLGVLVDHLVAGSKECRIVDTITDPNVLVTGHPYVDIWQAVRPKSLGISNWPPVKRGLPWKETVCEMFAWGEPIEGWRRINAAVRTYRDMQPPLIGAMESLIDFVTGADDPID